MKSFLARHWKKMTLGAMALGVLAYFALGLLIGHGVREAVTYAQSRYPGDPVSALMTVAASPDHALPARNRAVWALGQLGSQEALPTLRSLLTGSRCYHDSMVCQKEVKKAVEACSGGPNIGAWIWRRGDLVVSATP